MSRKKHKKVNDFYREIDPGRGRFDPDEKQPIQTRENPQAVRHIDKTRQDLMPREKRPRVIAAAARRDAMRT